MASSKKFWVFSDVFCFIGFITQILYNLVPIVFFIQLKYGVLKKERLSYIGILCLFGNAFIYFFVSIYHRKEGDEIDPLDFCNLAGFYFGYVYLLLYIYFINFKEKKLQGILLIVGLTLISFCFYLLIRFTVDSDDDNIWVKIFNWIGVGFNVLENLPLGFNLVYLIKYKVSERFTLFGAFFGIINVIAWLAWSIHATFIDDDNLYHSIIANILGICLHITQFILFFIFRGNEIEENKDNIESQEKMNEKLVDSSDDISNSNIDSLQTTEVTKEPDYINELL